MTTTLPLIPGLAESDFPDMVSVDITAPLSSAHRLSLPAPSLSLPADRVWLWGQPVWPGHRGLWDGRPRGDEGHGGPAVSLQVDDGGPLAARLGHSREHAPQKW